MVKIRSKIDADMYFGASAEIMKRAHELQKNMTPAEKILWEHLRNRKLGEYKFRRQHPINQFIADFYCSECKLVIEVDGKIHQELSQQERDRERTKIIQKFGIQVLRFENSQVENNLAFVLQSILRVLQSKQ